MQHTLKRSVPIPCGSNTQDFDTSPFSVRGSCLKPSHQPQMMRTNSIKTVKRNASRLRSSPSIILFVASARPTDRTHIHMPDNETLEPVIEEWMLSVVQNGGVERFDDLHVDRIDRNWRSPQLWIEEGWRLFRSLLACEIATSCQSRLFSASLFKLTRKDWHRFQHAGGVCESPELDGSVTLSFLAAMTCVPESGRQLGKASRVPMRPRTWQHEPI